MNLDTNILIAFFAEEAEVVDFVKTAREKKIILFISAIVEAELFSFTTLNDTDMENMRNFIDENLVVIPIDRYTLKFASYFRRKYPHIKAADSCVLGVSKMYGLDLFTRDRELLKNKEVNVIKI